jgi:hypothetical protein
LIFTTGTSLTEQNLIKAGTRLGITRFITLTVSPFVNFGDVKTTQASTIVTAPNPGIGSYTQFGIEASLTWKPRYRWTTGLTYDFVRRESGAMSGTATTNGISNSYIQNTIAFSIDYAF